MTAKEVSRMTERCRTRRRNLKRYTYTQSFSRLTGRDYEVSKEAPEVRGRARILLAGAVTMLFGTGIFFVIF